MTIRAKVRVVGVAEEGGHCVVTVAADAARLPIRTDAAAAAPFGAMLFREVDLTLDVGRAAPEGDRGDEVYRRHVERPYQMANLRRPVFAAGKSPEDAINAYAAAMGWGDVSNVRDLPGGEQCFTWGRSFVAGGTGFKAAGWDVPGGVVLTWWK